MQKNHLPIKQNGKFFIIDIAEQNIATFLQDLQKEHIAYDEISIDKPSLEDYFLQAVGERTETMKEVI